MQAWWWTIVPVALGAIGYFVRRWMEGRRRTEQLRRKLQALALHQGLSKAGLSLRELEELEREVTG